MKDNDWEHIIIIILFTGFLLLITSWIDVNRVNIKDQDKKIATLQQNIEVLLEQHNDLDKRIQKNQNALIYFDEELKSQGYDGYYQYKVVE